MKKLILLSFISFSFAAQGQTVLNGGFESWTSIPFDEPNNWYSPNWQVVPQFGFAIDTKVTGFSNSALRMQTYIVGQDTLGAYITNTPGDPISGKGGVPYSQKPTALSGYYRYSLGTTDTALILVIFKKNGSIINTDLFKIRGTGTQSAWTSFSYNLTLGSNPDTVILAAAASNLINNIGVQNGSFLELDQLVFTGSGITQQVPNNTFDTWTTQTVDIPGSWDVSGLGISKSTSAYAGSFAVKLENYSDGGSGNNVWPAGITNGYYGNNGSYGGRPFVSTKDTLTGYYKYTNLGADTGGVYIDVRKNGNSIWGTSYDFPAKATYTYFSIPLGPFGTSDSIRIDFASRKWPFNNCTLGSALWIDNLQLKSSPLGINKLFGENGSSVYPNPTAGILTVALKVNLPGDMNVSIYDALGKQVKNLVLTDPGALFQVPVEELSPGIYFYEVRNGDTVIRNKFVKQ